MIILCGHGNFGKELKNSVEMIAGVQDHVKFVSFTMDMAVTDVIDQYSKFIEECVAGEEVIILCDLFGGTPANAAAITKKYHENIRVLTGVNLPVVLALVMGEDVETSLSQGKVAMKEI